MRRPRSLDLRWPAFICGSKLSMIEISLQPGREKQILRGHPWVFGRGIRDLDPATPAGTVARVRAASGEVLGVGYVNPRCTIALRMCTREDRELDEAFFAQRVRDAVSLRSSLLANETDVYRLINGEGDFLPGFVVDRFADVLVMQCLTAGADALRDRLVEALRASLDSCAIVDFSRGSVRRAEGLDDRSETVCGDASDRVVARELGVASVIAPGTGQKTGYFCDQRDNRTRLRGLAQGLRVLDAFCYSGGFAVNAALGGADRVVAVDSSRPALDLLEANLEANDIEAGRVQVERAKVADYLRAADESFDAIVLDPPPLVRRKGDLRAGVRAYRDLNAWAMRRAAAGGLLFTFTCSQHVDAETFRRTVSEAAATVRRDAQVLDVLGPGIDHPIAVTHGEGEYLRGLLVRVL